MWACQLKAGDAVQVKVDRIEPTVAGVIRGIATTRAGRADNGLKFIVENYGKILAGTKVNHKCYYDF